jgi:5-methylcytosine-specific restriction protein A
MEYITSRSELPRTLEEMRDELRFNMWKWRLWPYQELVKGDVLYWYETQSTNIVWKTRIAELDRFSYQNKRQAEKRIRNMADFDMRQPYFQKAPAKGYCVVWKVEPLQKLNLPKPDGVKFPQQGWLRIDDRIAKDWLGTPRERKPMKPPAADAFDKRMLKIYEDAKNIGYVASRFRQKILRDGGLAAAKQWLRPSSKVTSGFQSLFDYDRFDLSVEAVALEVPWRELFTAEELATAEARLRQFGYFDPLRSKPSPSTQLSPDELPNEDQFPEGAKTQITVSAYERDPKARSSCIQHFGAVCYVCGFDFEKKYGIIGRGFINVHHLAPFAARSGLRLTDPKTDLRPVCPNCHSMLHRSTPPIPIATLKQIIRKVDG